MSPLAQGRGLKFKQVLKFYRKLWSPLAQGRGLKYNMITGYLNQTAVAPRAGAWIEMRRVCLRKMR